MGFRLPLKQNKHWQVVAAKVQGTGHLKANLSCQDTYDYKLSQDNLLIVAVADGAGFASLAELGSSLATSESVKTLSKYLEAKVFMDENGLNWENLMRCTFEETLNALMKEAHNKNCDLRDLSTTLILVAATPEMVACLQIGDGAVVVSLKSGKLLLTLSAPQQGEYLNQTNFLTSLRAIEKSKFSLLEGDMAFIAVFSDGIQHLALKSPNYSPHPPFFIPLQQFVTQTWENPEAQLQLTRFLNSDRVNERTDDDKTLVLAAMIINDH